jgi:TolB protein
MVMIPLLRTVLLTIILAPSVHALAADPARTIAFIAFTDGYWQAWVMAPDGSGQRQVTRSPYDKQRLSWYPGGKSLLVNGNQGELYRAEVDDGRETPIPHTIAEINDAVIAPDGKHIAFSANAAGSSDGSDIWVMNADGSHLLKKVSMQWLQHGPAWSADGTVLYFLSGDTREAHNIWRLSLADNRFDQLTDHTLFHFDIAVSRKGDLAYSSNRTGNYEIWEMTPDGKTRQITDDPSLDAKPAWSPRGDSLVFESTRTGMSNLWRVDLRGDPPVRLTDFARGARAPVWYQGTERRP